MWGYTAIALATGVAILIVALSISGRTILKNRSESTAYANAMRRSGETGKRLVVVGDPSRGWFGAGYGGGDVCMHGMAATKWFAEQPADSAVVLLDGIENEEILRVAGRDVFQTD